MREIAIWAFIIVSIPMVFRRPLIGLIIYLCANIIRPEMLFWGGSGASYFFRVYYFMILLACFFKGTFTVYRKVFQREYILMLWLVSGVIISAVFSQYVVFRQDYYITEIVKNMGIIALMYMLTDDYADIVRIQNAMLGCFAFLGIWGIEQQLRGNERLEGLGGNAWGDSNGVAAVFVLFLPVALAMAFSAEKRRNFWIALGVAGVMVALVIGTKSRGGLLGLLAGLFCFGFYSRNTLKTLKIAFILALIIIPFAADSYFERMKTIQVSDSEDMEGSARSRLILWQAGLMVFADNPLLGTGYMTYPEAKMKYENNFLYLEDNFRNNVFRKENKKVTHNAYIQMLSDCGLLGALPFFLLVTGGVFRGFWSRKRLKVLNNKDRQLILICGLSAGITGFAVCIFFINAASLLFLYVQLGIIGILCRMVSLESNNAAGALGNNSLA